MIRISLQLLTTLGPPGTILALLLAGHMLSDFVLQTDRMARGKGDVRVRLRHTMIVFATAALTIGPLMTFEALVVILVSSLLHFVMDWIKMARVSTRGDTLLLFGLDQIFHLSVLFVLWLVFLPKYQFPPVPIIGGQIPATWGPTLTAVACTLMGFAFNVLGGATIVRLVLSRYAHLNRRDDGTPNAADGSGRVIGILERLIVLSLVLMAQWSALGFVLAAKSLARFEDFKKKDFAEYYLMGTLASVAVGILTGLVILQLV